MNKKSQRTFGECVKIFENFENVFSKFRLCLIYKYLNIDENNRS